MTIMFSDVRGFTSISETYKHDPQGLTALMNRFLTPLTDAILDAQGHHRQIHGRRHHGVLECAARRRRAPDQRLRGRGPHAGADRRAQQGARAGSRAKAATSIFRSMSASASTPASAWSATWAPT